LNAITPALNSALADIAVELEIQGRGALENVEEGPTRKRLQTVFRELKKHVNVLESGIAALLSLYQLVYARHEMSSAIEEIEKELEQRIRGMKGEGDG
jgi:hypothetical protein